MNDLIKLYEAKSDNELARIVAANYAIAHTIVASNPQMAQDAGFELFDSDWAKRYWRSVVAQITGIKLADEVRSWAIGASIDQLVELIVEHYSLPPGALPAAVALAIILLKATKASK
jgi:hypothetical protein